MPLSSAACAQEAGALISQHRRRPCVGCTPAIPALGSGGEGPEVQGDPCLQLWLNEKHQEDQTRPKSQTDCILKATKFC